MEDQEGAVNVRVNGGCSGIQTLSQIAELIAGSWHAADQNHCSVDQARAHGQAPGLFACQSLFLTHATLLSVLKEGSKS